MEMIQKNQTYHNSGMPSKVLNIINKQKSRVSDLYSLFSIVETFPNNIYLENLVFLGQKSGALNNNYDFKGLSSSLGSPASMSLIGDYIILEKKGYLWDDGNTPELSITNKPFKLEIPELKDKAKLDKLLEFDYTKIDNLAKIIKVKEELEKENITDKLDLIEKITGYIVYESGGRGLNDFRILTQGRVLDYINEFEQIVALS